MNNSIIRPFAKGQTSCRKKLPCSHVTKTYGINNVELRTACCNTNTFAKHAVAPTKHSTTNRRAIIGITHKSPLRYHPTPRLLTYM